MLCISYCIRSKSTHDGATSSNSNVCVSERERPESLIINSFTLQQFHSESAKVCSNICVHVYNEPMVLVTSNGQKKWYSRKRIRIEWKICLKMCANSHLNNERKKEIGSKTREKNKTKQKRTWANEYTSAKCTQRYTRITTFHCAMPMLHTGEAIFLETFWYDMCVCVLLQYAKLYKTLQL